MRTSKRPIKSGTSGKKLVDDLKPFGKLIQTMYCNDSLLSKAQLAKFSQTSLVMLSAIQKQIDAKLIQQPLDMTTITYCNDRRLMKLMVVLPSGERYSVQQFIQRLNQLLSGEITEAEFYNQHPKEQQQVLQSKTDDKLKRANQTLKQRLKQLTDNKIQLDQKYQQLENELLQTQKDLHDQALINQELVKKLQELREINDTYQFKIDKQQVEMREIREQVRQKQTKMNQAQRVKEKFEPKHVCLKSDNRHLLEKIATLQEKLSKLQQRQPQKQSSKVMEISKISRSERLRCLTSELNETCVSEYHPLLRLVDKYNQLVSEDVVLWHQIQGHLVRLGEDWLFIDQQANQYGLTTEAMNGIPIEDLTTAYYYSARQRRDTGAIILIRQLNLPVVDEADKEKQTDELLTPVAKFDCQVLIISWWGETVKNAAHKLKRLGIEVTWLDPSDVNNDKIVNEMHKPQYDFQLIVLRGAHHEIVTAAHRLRRMGRRVKVANNPGVSAMVTFVQEALKGINDKPSLI
ncbi:hypothetical protein [Weissella bombi]|uniref:Uncharacterized protein n=1 Tax=Weissella bombi TaxID=1505725 RepID=A0A1C4BT51_9LACO|nr:hypothetical protein [Weissella bombi]SCC10089.1 hypothetical protein GA0061074_11516 [Weissella bombi]